VVVENIVMHRDNGESRVEAVRKALKEITVPLVGSTITPVVVFLPLIATTGVTGSFFRALAITMAASLLTSLVLALTWTPGLSLVLLRDRSGDPAGHEHKTGRFLSRILHIHRRLLDWALAKPLWLGVACLLLVVGTYFGYKGLGSDLLPGMDEGGFILDYIMPAGSSLTETNRVLDHVERLLREQPEVESTSRRTGMQMGLAAVTEANSGDFTVKLKAKRSRSIDDVMEEVRAEIKRTEPELDVEFIQVLQDMIGDLSNAPEPIQIKIFSPDEGLLTQLGPRVGDAIGKIPGVVDVKNGIEDTISGPATSFQVSPVMAARFGFTPTEVAEDATSILDGLPATDPLIANGRPYTIRLRLGDEHRASLDAIEKHRLQFGYRPHGYSRLAGRHPAIAAPERNPARKPAAHGGSYRAPGGLRPRHGDEQSPPDGRGDASSAFSARLLRRHLRRAAEVVPRPAAGAAVGAGSGVRCTADGVSEFPRAHRHPHVLGAVDLGGDPGVAHHPHYVQRGVVHGADHGHRHCGQERHPASRCGRAIPRRGARIPRAR